MKKPLAPEAIRAARLSRVPGVTIAEAVARFGVARSTVERARKEMAAETAPSLAELALAALTSNGTKEEGDLAGLDGRRRWIDYINHDGCTAADVRRMLEKLAEGGVLRIDGERWKLAKPWP